MMDARPEALVCAWTWNGDEFSEDPAVCPVDYA